MLVLCYPKCTTCKKAVKWLEDNQVEFTYRDIKTDRPTEAELRKWHSVSGLLYKELHLKDRLPHMTEDEMFELLSSDGMLVKRPLAVCDDKVLAGFKEAEWKALK